MIDTLRFQIHGTEEQKESIRKIGKELVSKDNETDSTQFTIYTKDIEIGSYSYGINIFILQDEKIYLEFSAPKIFYGHNIYLFYPQDLEKVLQTVYSKIEETFKISFPHYSKWVIQRLDLCYAWKFPNQEDAFTALLLLQSYDFERKKKTIEDTGFKFRGSVYDFKAYLKLDEYKEHDFKRLVKKFDSFAYQLQDIAEGILRIEFTLRKKQLNYIFDRNIRYTDINDLELLYETMNKYFKKMLKNADTKIIPYTEVVDKLLSYYSPRTAWSCIEFYNFYNPPNAHKRKFNRRLMKNKLHRSTLSRKIKLLTKAGVGVPNLGTKLQFNFEIPSKYVINSVPDPVAEATDQQLAIPGTEVIGIGSQGRR